MFSKKMPVLIGSVATTMLMSGASAAGQNMGPGMMQGGMMHDGMMCPGMDGHAGLMRDPEVKLRISETNDGVTIMWTSANAEKATALKNMAKRMQAMHEQGAPAGSK